ncbi:DUF58 domain-containing protein [Aquibacillus halophilus]|uniref:DUF58 domain-containing protein n=2 Tax=Aquibacillus halophilus TaxID=930132 RepID=A0A6A8DJP4_9BACI|nr:DUF58 domain-containing protein [Aquibacillus halophilus]
MIALTVIGISWTYITLANILFFLISLIDLLQSPKRKQLSFKRTIPNEMERGISYPVKIEIENTSTHKCRFRFVDGIPQSFLKSFPIKGTVGKLETSVVSYQTVAPIRGEFLIDRLYVRYRSMLGFWEKQTSSMLRDDVKVIPDLTETKQYLENAQQFLLAEGLKVRKRKSGAGEFDKIRSFVVGDDPRKINWRQTAKLQEVMTNEYEPEHGKYITILIDCGRMMGAQLKKGDRLEKALEAAITVAAAALKKGDYISILAFAKDIKVYVPPAKGSNHLQKILHTIYNLEVDASESNYGAVFHYLQTVQNKRSLLLLFSDVGTFLHEESALVYIKRLRQKHLFLMIGIEDETLKLTTKIEPITTQRAMVKSIAQQQLELKKREKIRWEKQGLQMVEVSEERLATAVVSHYIDIMNRGLL